MLSILFSRESCNPILHRKLRSIQFFRGTQLHGGQNHNRLMARYLNLIDKGRFRVLMINLEKKKDQSKVGVIYHKSGMRWIRYKFGSQLLWENQIIKFWVSWLWVENMPWVERIWRKMTNQDGEHNVRPIHCKIVVHLGGPIFENSKPCYERIFNFHYKLRMTPYPIGRSDSSHLDVPGLNPRYAIFSVCTGFPCAGSFLGSYPRLSPMWFRTWIFMVPGPCLMETTS